MLPVRCCYLFLHDALPNPPSCRSYKATLTNHLESNTAGLCVLGTTAEAATMSLTNRAKILQATVDTVAGKIPFMVGCGTINMDDVVVYMEQAREFGADAALVVTPYYVKPTQVRELSEPTSSGSNLLLFLPPPSLSQFAASLTPYPPP